MMYDKLRTDLKTAMLEKDDTRVSTLRLILAAVKDKEISLRSIENVKTDNENVINDHTVAEILMKMRKQRIDSISMYEEAGRLELVECERHEMDIIETYLPKQLSQNEMEILVRTRLDDLNANSLRDMGRVMASLKETHTGKVDFAKAGIIVKSFLTA